MAHVFLPIRSAHATSRTRAMRMLCSFLDGSHCQAINYLLSHKLIVVGTLVGYDDWPAGGRSGGEQRAHREITKQWGLRCNTRHVAGGLA